MILLDPGTRVEKTRLYRIPNLLAAILKSRLE